MMPRVQGFLRRLRQADSWAWPLTIAVALIYTACFASFIKRHTSLPFYDGYVYVQKTLDLAEAFHKASLAQRLNPIFYFKGRQPERPPLLIAAAAIALGPEPSNAGVAYVWLIVRVVVILLALYLLSREFGTSRFVPAAALVIFASPLMCTFGRLYFMDEPFAAFGLLAFTLILIDDRRQTLGSAFAAAAGILALFLVKPVAPAFVLPFCVIRAVRALLPLRHGWSGLGPQAGLIKWAIPYLLLLGVMLALVNASPYGPGIREQFKLGMTGYWHQDIGIRGALKLIALVLPPWLLIAWLAVLPLARGFQHRVVLLYLGGGLLWWLWFSFFFTYTVEDRLLGQAMPYAVTAVLLWICQRPRAAVAVTAVAAIFFAYNTLAANTGMKPRSSPRKIARFLSPTPGYQKPVPEVGLLPFATELKAALADKPRRVCGVFGDVYVEPNSLNMALRMGTQPPHPKIHWVSANPADFDLAKFCRTRWFITKTRRPNFGLTNTGIWTAMNCFHALITDLESPLHPYFCKVLESPIQQPDIKDTLVLWHLPSTPPDAAFAESLRWLKPRLTNDPPAFAAVIDSQLAALSATASAAASSNDGKSLESKE